MARARNLKPGFFKNEFLAELSPHARLLFAGLWMLADRRGRMEDRPLRIKGEIFPFETVDVDALLQELANSPGDFITRYAVEGKAFIQIENFHKHQNPHHREAESTIPQHFSEKPRAGLGPSLTQVVPSLGNSGTSRAESLLPITESLTLKPEVDASASECVSVNPLEKVTEENKRLGQQGMSYLASLNSPNHMNLGWITGYFSLELQALEESRPELPKPEIVKIWRDVCDLAVSKNATAPQWLKTTFKNKLNAWTPEQQKTHAHGAANGQREEQAKALLTFPFVLNTITDEIIPSEELEYREETPNGLYRGLATYFPIAHLQGLTEFPPDA